MRPRDVCHSKIVVNYLKEASQNSRITYIVKFLSVANVNQRTVIGEQFKSCTRQKGVAFSCGAYFCL